MAGEDRDADLDRLGKALLHRLLQLVGRQVGEDAGEGADEDRPELGMAAEVGDREVLAERDLVAEGGGEQVGVGVAADVAQDRLVIDLAPLGGVEAQRRGEPHREHARAKREIPRLAGGEVGGIGEHHHEVGTSNRDVSHAHAPPAATEHDAQNSVQASFRCAGRGNSRRIGNPPHVAARQARHR